MTTNKRAFAIARAIELNEAMKPKRTASLRTLNVGSILKVIGFRTVILSDGKQIIGTFKANDGETVNIDVTAMFADKEHLQEKEVSDVFMVYKGLNVDGQEQVTFVCTREKANLVALNAARKSSQNEMPSSRGTSSDSSDDDSGADSDTDCKAAKTKNNLRMNIRMR